MQRRTRVAEEIRTSWNSRLNICAASFTDASKRFIESANFVYTQALSTLIRFQTKTELFCSVFKKICVHTYSFCVVFARPHYNADQERSHRVASHDTVEWSGVYLMTSPSDSIVFSVHTRKQRFQKASFSNRSTLESVFEWLRFRLLFSAL